MIRKVKNSISSISRFATFSFYRKGSYIADLGAMVVTGKFFFIILTLAIEFLYYVF